MSFVRRILLFLAIAVGVVLLLVGVAVLLVDSAALTRWAQENVVPKIEERLGRDVSLESVDVDVFPRPGIALEGFRVAGGGPQPLVAADRAVIHLSLWPLVVSRGREVRVTGVEIVRPEVTLLRSTSGTWDHEEPVRRLREQPQGPERAWSVETLRVRDGLVRLVDSTAPDGSAYVELNDLDVKIDHLGPGLPLDLSAQAALQSRTQNVRVSLQLDALPAAGSPPPRATGRIDLDDIPLALVRPYLPAGATQVITGGSLDAALTLATRADGAFVVDGGVQVPDLRLRGQPASARTSLAATIPAGATQAWVAELRDVAVRGPGVDLGGSASARGPLPSVRFDIRGPLLDLDAVLGLLPQEEKPAEGPLLSPQARRRVAQMDVTGDVSVDRVVSNRLTATGLRARATLKGGTLRIDGGTAAFHGGTADLGGTTIDLTREDPVWRLRARLEHADLGAAMQQISGAAPLAGDLNARVDLTGAGVDWASIARQITGSAGVVVENGSWSSVDLAAQVTAELRQGLEKLGAAGFLQGLPSGNETRLRRLAASFRVQDGWMSLTEPLELATPFGTGSLTGRVSLDHRLDLRGSITLTPELVSQMTGRALQRSVRVPLVLGGTLQAPQVSGVDAGALAQELLPRREVERRAREEAERREEAIRREASRRLKGLLAPGG